MAAAVATVLLLVLAGWCLSRGIRVESSTAGLLTAPIPQTRLFGGWLVGAAGAVTAAILCGLEAGAGLPERLRAYRRR